MTSSPEFLAVILAATTGARLFPMTSAETPKHLLPIAGVPALLRLLQSVAASGFSQCVVSLAHGDSVTLDLLKRELGEQVGTNVYRFQSTLQVTICILSDDCAGSAEALRQMDDVIPADSHVVVLPGDLVVFETSVLTGLVDAHRQSNLPPTTVSTSCTILLANVGEQDEHGVPLKESAKVRRTPNTRMKIMKAVPLTCLPCRCSKRRVDLREKTKTLNTLHCHTLLHCRHALCGSNPRLTLKRMRG